MIPWPFAIVMSIFLFLFAVTMLSFAVALEVMLVMRLMATLQNWRQFSMSLVTAVIIGPFAYMFGRGAYLLGSDIIDGLILRFFL